VLSLLAAGIPALALADDSPDDLVAEALAGVRDNNHETEITHSSVLGELASSAELAAAQPDMRAIFAAREPLAIDFTGQQQRQLDRDYRYYTFSGRPRLAEIYRMGITGAHIRDVDLRPEVVVSFIEPGSPAEGALEVDDVIVGANGRMFRHRRDPRVPLGFALAEAQTDALGGVLTLHVVRSGKSFNARIELGISGAYSRTWPYDCPRSKAIGDRMVQFILENEPGSLIGVHYGGGGFWGPLFMMGSGDDAALDMVRRHFYRGMIKDAYPEPAGGRSWGSAYTLVNLCEYYLLTGDSAALPAITYHKTILQNGQSAAGGWGHGCPCSGYGEVNNVGFVALMGLALARRCGVEMDEPRLAQSIRYFGRFIGGSAPYGNHRGGNRGGRMDNGMASMGALTFRFFDEETVARRWGRTVCYMWMARERGHGEGIFNFSWGPAGAALGPPDEFQAFMNNLVWYYELARTREGGIKFLRGGHFSYPIGQTAAVGMAFMLPRKKIYVTGAPPSVFAMRPPNDALAEAADLYKQKRWQPLHQRLAAYTANATKPHQEYATQLLAAYRRMEHHVAASLELAAGNIASGETKLAREQLDALERLLGETRPEIARLRERLPAIDTIRRRQPRATIEPQTRAFAYDPNEPPCYDWEYILPLAAKSKDSQGETYRIYKIAADSHPPADWHQPDFDAAAWRVHRGAVNVGRGDEFLLRRTFTTLAAPSAYKHLQLTTRGASGEVYLNGFKLADVRQGDLYLRPNISDVLRKKGPNVLAARLTADGTVDLGIKAGPPVVPNLDDLLDDL